MTVSTFDGMSNYFDDNSILQGSNNVELIVDVKADVSDAIEWRLHVIVPTKDLTANPVTETTTVIWLGEAYQKTFIRYLIKAADLPVVGIYKINSFVKWANKEIPGETAMLNVRALGE